VFAHYVKDMKNQINEAKRLQKLAGLLNENNTPTFRPAMYNNQPSITDGIYHYLFGKAKFASDHSSLYVYDKAGEEVASYDITDEWSSIKQNPTLLAAYKELDKQSKGVDEGIGKALGTAALGAALAFGSPKTATAQSPQQIEKSVSDSTTNISSMDDKKAGETLLISFQKNPFTADMWSKLSGDNAKLFRIMKTMLDRLQVKPEDIQPEDIAALGRKYKKTTSAAEFLDRAKALEAAKKKGIEETVNEALRKFRKGK
jgi:hypothetical protein